MLAKRLFHMLVITPYLVITSLMVADIFTKALEIALFVRFRDKLMNITTTTTLIDDKGRIAKLGGRACTQLWNKIASYTIDRPT